MILSNPHSGKTGCAGRSLYVEMQPFELGPDDAWQLLQRVVNSQELRRATRLRELLLYLGERSLKTHAAPIREQEIGAAVFNRSENYDTNVDNIVRVNVSELRKRLCHYFETEGLNEAVLIEIPRGGYLPVFVARVAAAPATPEVGEVAPAGTVEMAAAEMPSAPATRRSLWSRERWMLPVLAGLLGLAVVVAGIFYWQVRSLRDELQPWKADANRSAFWGQFFAAGAPVDIVTADTSYALAEDLLKKPISLNAYLDYEYKSYANVPDLTPQTRDALDLVLDRNTGSVGDFEAAEQVLALNPRSPLLRLASARAYTPQSIKSHSVVLIGSRQSNPWVELYKDRMNFYVEYDPARHRSYVVNRSPAKGEQSVYEIVNDPNRDYSVVTFLPNLTGQNYVLILAGTDSQGTRAAGEFITSGEGLAAVRRQLPAGQNPYFEVLLDSTRLEGTTLQTKVVAMRGYQH